MPKPVKSDPPAGRLSLVLGHLIFLGVFLLRLGAVLRLTHSSLLLTSRGDMHLYNDWAKDILHGQFSQHLAFYVFFFFKQKTAYEMDGRLEFRRVLFRSRQAAQREQRSTGAFGLHVEAQNVLE